MSNNIYEVFLANSATCYADLESLASKPDTIFSKKDKLTGENVFHLCFRENGERRLNAIIKGLENLRSEGQINRSIIKAVNANTKDSLGLTPLHLAAQFSADYYKPAGRFESRPTVIYRMVKKILELGADPTKTDFNGRTPDETIGISDNVKQILQYAKHKHQSPAPKKPLKAALIEGNLYAVHKIIDRNAINLSGSENEKYKLMLSALKKGIENSIEEDKILEILRKLYHKFKNSTFEIPSSVPTAACSSPPSSGIEVEERTVQEPSTSSSSEIDEGAIQEPSTSSSLEIDEEAIQESSTSSSIEIEEKAVREPASSFSQVIMDIERNRDKTLLTIAVEKGLPKIVDFLLNTCKIDVLKKDSLGNTIMHVAAEVEEVNEGHRLVYNQLMHLKACGRLVYAKNNDGRYPLHLARNLEICTLLCSLGPNLIHEKDNHQNGPENYYRGYKCYHDMRDALTFFDPKVLPEKKVALLEKIVAVLTRMCPDEIPEKVKNGLETVISSGIDLGIEFFTLFKNSISSKMKSYFESDSK